jgi:hypothetical protein
MGIISEAPSSLSLQAQLERASITCVCARVGARAGTYIITRWQDNHVISADMRGAGQVLSRVPTRFNWAWSPLDQIGS